MTAADSTPLDGQRRRERELASLYATVRTLTVLQEVDDVLTAIVRNAHDLVATDVTYLSVTEGDELILRAAEGVVSPEFRTARVPVSTGVAGRAIAARAPFWVRDYRAAGDIQHDHVFDEALTNEGIVALLGVPLIAGERVLGVLYGANRVARPFPNEEVALLSAFADHAAVALENARLYEQQSRALRDLSAAYSTIETQVQVMERSARVHESLTRLVLSGSDVGEIAALLSRMMGSDVMILDRGDRMVAWETLDEDRDAFARAGFDDGSGGPSEAVAAAVADSRQTGRCETFTGPDGRRCDAAAVVAGGSYLGAVVLSQAGDPHPADLRTVERAAQIVGLLTLQQDAVAQAEERVRGELLAEVLSGTAPLSAPQRARGRARGLDLDAMRVLIAVQSPAPPEAIARILRRVARESGGLAGEHHNVPTLLVPAEDEAAAVAATHSALRNGTGTDVIACGAPVELAAESAGRAFALASRCCRLLSSLGVVDRAATTSDLALYATVFDPERRQELELFLQDTIGPLRDYDAGGRSDLLGTLVAYFDNNGNLTRSARQLHIHMNTLLKRLDRVGTLIGEDWQRPDRSLRLHLALRLHQLAADLSADG